MLFSGAKSDRHARPGAVAVLDIGTHKITCLIGRMESSGHVRVLGAGHQGSRGVRSGGIVELMEAEAAIRAAVDKAEKMAGFTITSVALSVTSKHLASHHLQVETPFYSGEVQDRDLKRVLQSALAEFSDPEEVIVHAIPMNWSVDGEDGIQDPRGMFGSQLGADLHIVTAPLGALRNLVHCVERCHLRVSRVIASPYASGRGVLVEDELDLGATVIDMGAGTTTIGVFRDGGLIYVDAINVGGSHVSADIARGLSTPREDAERLKTLYGSALFAPDDDQQMIECPLIRGRGPANKAPRSRLTGIIRPRVEETFELLHKRLQRAGIDELAGRRIVLTGGASQLNGVRELAIRIFGRKVRMGRPVGVAGLGVDLSGPGFSVAAGLLRQQAEGLNEAISGPPDLSGRRRKERRYAGGGVAQTLKWFKEHF